MLGLQRSSRPGPQSARSASSLNHTSHRSAGRSGARSTTPAAPKGCRPLLSTSSSAYGKCSTARLTASRYSPPASSASSPGRHEPGRGEPARVPHPGPRAEARPERSRQLEEARLVRPPRPRLGHRGGRVALHARGVGKVHQALGARERVRRRAEVSAGGVRDVRVAQRDDVVRVRHNGGGEQRGRLTRPPRGAPRRPARRRRRRRRRAPRIRSPRAADARRSRRRRGRRRPRRPRAGRRRPTAAAARRVRRAASASALETWA